MKISIDIHRLISLGWNFDEDYNETFFHVSKEHFEDISVVHFYHNGYKIEYNNKEYHIQILSYDFSPYNVDCLLRDIGKMLYGRCKVTK